MKYHYFQRRPTYPVVRNGACTSSSSKLAIRVGDTHRWGVWLGRHVC